METECDFFKISHGRFGIFPRRPHSPCFCSSIIRELGKLYNTARASVAESSTSMCDGGILLCQGNSQQNSSSSCAAIFQGQPYQWRQSDIFSGSAMVALGSSHEGRTRLGFLPAASSVSCESFPTKPMRHLQNLTMPCACGDYQWGQRGSFSRSAMGALGSSHAGSHFP